MVSPVENFQLPTSRTWKGSTSRSLDTGGGAAEITVLPCAPVRLNAGFFTAGIGPSQQCLKMSYSPVEETLLSHTQ